MKIATITLKNFRSFKDATIDGLGLWNWFAGRNGSGKSTILDAIAFGLTGSCRGAETGRGLDELRTQGGGQRETRKARVALVLADDLGTIQRDETMGPRASVQTAVDSLLAVPTQTVRAALYSSEILRIERKAAQRMILDLAKGDGIEVAGEIRELIEALLGDKVSAVTLSEIEGLHRRAYDLRAELGRARRAEAGPEPPWPVEVLGPMPPAGISPEAIRSKLAALRVERDTLARVAEAASKAPALRKQRLGRAQARLAAAREAADSGPNPDAIRTTAAPLLEEYAEAEAAAKEIDAARRARAGEVGLLEGGVKALGKQIQDFEAVENECPTCLQKVRAVTKREIGEKLRAQYDALARDLAKARGILDSTPEVPDLGAIRRKIADLEGQEQRYLVNKQAVDKAEAELAEIAAEVCRADDEPVEDYPAKLAELDARIQKGEEKLTALVAWGGARDEWQRRQLAQASARETYEAVERLVEALGPNGIRQSLGGDGVAGFQARISERMAVMGFRSVDFGPLIRLEDDPLIDGRPARMLSTSEQLRFGIGFSLAVSEATGLGLVAIDGWELLDDRTTRAASSVLAEVAAKGDTQLFVFGTPKTGFDAYLTAAANGSPLGIRFYAVAKDPREGSRVWVPGQQEAVA